jgi:hypothetical protein
VSIEVDLYDDDEYVDARDEQQDVEREVRAKLTTSGAELHTVEGYVVADA